MYGCLSTCYTVLMYLWVQEKDLQRLLRIYQFWAHEMYPKGQFRDTVEKVEKLCHSKRMAVSWFRCLDRWPS